MKKHEQVKITLNHLKTPEPTLVFFKSKLNTPLKAPGFLRAFGIGQEVEALVPSKFQELDPNHRIIIFLQGQLGEDFLRSHLFDGTPQARRRVFGAVFLWSESQ